MAFKQDRDIIRINYDIELTSLDSPKLTPPTQDCTVVGHIP